LPAQRILINGQLFEVRQNLYDFLIAAQQHAFSGAFWIDQICIDQDNVPEKNHQVTMMASIYKRALKVVVWLGGLTEEQEAIMPYIELRMLAEYGGGPTVTIETQGGGTYGPSLSTVIEFFQNPYWTRMWIVQELVTSQDFTAYGARNSISGWALRCFAVWLDDHVPARENTQLMSPHVNYLLTRAPNGSARYLLSDLFYHLSQGQCWDLKDRLYSLRALLTNGTSVVIDYSKPVTDVLLDAVRLIGRETTARTGLHAIAAVGTTSGMAAHVLACDLPKAMGLGT